MHASDMGNGAKADGGQESRSDDGAVYLRRRIDLATGTSLVLGTVVGSGIFIAPKGVLENSGSVGVSLLVWALCGVLSMAGALCFAELGTTFRKSGGQYVYLQETLGPLPAFLCLWVEFIVIRPATVSVVSLAFGRYVIEPFFAPCATPEVLVKLVSLLAMSIVVAVNCWSVKLTSNMQVTLTFIKVFALILIIVPGIMALARGEVKNFDNAFDSETLTLTKLPLAFYAGLYAYGGWFNLNCVTEEVINPNRNIPLSIVISMVTVTVCYVLVNVSYYTVMTSAELLASGAVAMTFAHRTLQSIASIIPMLVAMSCLGSLNGNIFTMSRMLFVGAREGHFPALLSMIHIRRETPLPAVLMMYPLVVVMLIRGNLFQLVNFAAFSRWLFIAMTTLGLLIHRYRFPLHSRPLKVPVAITISFTAVCFFIVGLSLYSDPWNTGSSCAVTLSGVPVYYLTVHQQRLPVRWRNAFQSCTKHLQILLEVIQQEVKTY
ncbi:cystine/glutamate transporter-like isoform X1 [Paramormyrops kingsleyae]|uniref:cystine/glutamate transporter-like isoform X1 n=1 Tax=Paramormyrops kingsleyae TaxID=1676925 RepID=UPI003B97C6A7